MILPDPNTIALGGVATGNINAKLALIVAGIIRIRGSSSLEVATTAKIGISKIAVAELLVSSVRNVTTRQINNTSTKTGTLLSPSNDPPNSSLNPEPPKALAIQTPPAYRIRMPHGIVFAVSQSSSRYVFPSFDFFPDGTTNIKNAPNIAIEASFASVKPVQLLQPPNGCLRVTQSRAVAAKMLSVRISSLRHAPTSGSFTDTSDLSERVNHSHAIGSIIRLIGKANNIHCTKL